MTNETNEEGWGIKPATNQGPQQERVSRIEMVPFSKIKNQIDSNYSEIQTKTTRAVIERLGLGLTQVTKKPAYSQTTD